MVGSSNGDKAGLKRAKALHKRMVDAKQPGRVRPGAPAAPCRTRGYCGISGDRRQSAIEGPGGGGIEITYKDPRAVSVALSEIVFESGQFQ